MPRARRRLSKTGTYHIMLRGINRQSIFVEDEDNEKFIDFSPNTTGKLPSRYLRIA